MASTFEIVGNYTHQEALTKLHELLLDEGWVIEAADADAIGTGTASDPAWDKTFATSTDVGVVVYRMAATPQTTEWRVRIRARFGSASNTFHLYVQVGTGNSGTDLTGVVTAELGHSINTTNNIGNTYISVTPEGLCVLGNNAARGLMACVELARNQDGTLSDDCIKHCWAPNASGSVGYGPVIAAGHPSVRVDTVMVYPARPACYINTMNATSTVRFVSLSDGVTAELPAGPMFFNKEYSGFSNMVLQVPQSRFDAGDILEFVIGSETLRFLALNYTNSVLGSAGFQTRPAIRVL